MIPPGFSTLTTHCRRSPVPDQGITAISSVVFLGIWWREPSLKVVRPVTVTGSMREWTVQDFYGARDYEVGLV